VSLTQLETSHCAHRSADSSGRHLQLMLVMSHVRLEPTNLLPRCTLLSSVLGMWLSALPAVLCSSAMPGGFTRSTLLGACHDRKEARNYGLQVHGQEGRKPNQLRGAAHGYFALARSISGTRYSLILPVRSCNNRALATSCSHLPGFV